MPKWTPDLDTSFSKDQSIETSILSVTAPGPQVIQGTAAIKLSRQINEYGASLAAKDPSKYGFFAAIPDPCEDMNAVLEEIRYSLKTLKADGITLYSRYGNDNHYLGHPISVHSGKSWRSTRRLYSSTQRTRWTPILRTHTFRWYANLPTPLMINPLTPSANIRLLPRNRPRRR